MKTNSDFVNGKIEKSLQKKELMMAVMSLLLMWAGYYADNNLFSGNILFSLIVSMIFIILGLCTVFPLIWVTRITGEGIEGLGITKKKTSNLVAVFYDTWYMAFHGDEELHRKYRFFNNDVI